MGTLATVVRDMVFGRSPRETYWEARAGLDLMARLARSENRVFGQHVTADQLRFVLNRVRPIEGEIKERAAAAIAWLVRAQDATPDRGVSLGYFPCTTAEPGGWVASYPETTGYIIPTLLEASDRWHRPDVRDRAIEMAVWEIEMQMPSGAVQGGPVGRGKPMAAAFNTGMVLQGYSAGFRAATDRRFLEAGRRAADFLVNDMGGDGYFQSHGGHVTRHRIKTYECLCAWGLYRFGEDSGEARYRQAAVRVAEAALAQQRANGWFANNCLTNPGAPLVHTIAYTLQGLLEVGILAGRSDIVAAVRRGVDPMLERMSPRGFLAGRFTSSWQPAVFSSCLSGSAQVAVVCYRLFEITGERRYATAADSLVNYLKALQATSENPGIDGAIAGSFPIVGSYMRAGYPNWATKYYLDALMLQDRLGAR